MLHLQCTAFSLAGGLKVGQQWHGISISNTLLTGVTSNEKVREVFCDLLPGMEKANSHADVVRESEKLTAILHICEILLTTGEATYIIEMHTF